MRAQIHYPAPTFLITGMCTALLMFAGVATNLFAVSGPGPTFKVDGLGLDCDPNGIGNNLNSFHPSPGAPAGAGRAVAYDGATTLYYTVLTSSDPALTDPNIYMSTTSGVFLGAIPLAGRDFLCGALSWDPVSTPGQPQLWCGAYDGSGVYTIDPVTGVATPKFSHPFLPGESCFTQPPGLIDGIAFDLDDGTLWLSDDAATMIYNVDQGGNNVSGPFATPLHPLDGQPGCNAGIAITPNGCLNLALLGAPFHPLPVIVKIAKNSPSGPIINSFVHTVGPASSGAEDLAFDANTFAPHCVLWSNTPSSPNLLTAWKIECECDCQPSPQPIDHYKCYQVKAQKKICQDDPTAKCKLDSDCVTGICLQKFPKGVNVSLEDQFGTVGVEVKKPRNLCLPVEKVPQGPPIQDPDLHYKEYQVKGGSKLGVRVLVTDQFGPHVVELGKPKTLLVPTSKDLLVPVPPPGPGSDHYLCYQAKHKKKSCTGDLLTKCKSDADCAGAGGTCDLGFTSISGQGLLDQFGSESVEVKKIKFLCAPAKKTPPGDPIVNGTDHLVGYQIKGPGLVVSAHTNNQFGPELVTTKKPKVLYVPALKNPGVGPICGNDTVEGTEQCDGTDATVCPGMCQADCTCPLVCGDTFPVCDGPCPNPEDVCTLIDPNGLGNPATCVGGPLAGLPCTAHSGCPGSLCSNGCSCECVLQETQCLCNGVPVGVPATGPCTTQSSCAPLCQPKETPDCLSFDCPSLCGNGTVELFCCEQCDDGNTMSGDGCSSSCQAE